jgi:hypothetical protein
VTQSGDLTPQQTAWIIELSKRSRGEPLEWCLAQAGGVAALANLRYRETWMGIPSDQSFYLELAKRGYLGFHFTHQHDLVLCPTARALDCAQRADLPGRQRVWNAVKRQLVGERPAWASAVLVLGGGTIALALRTVVFWVLGIAR